MSINWQSIADKAAALLPEIKAALDAADPLIPAGAFKIADEALSFLAGLGESAIANSQLGAPQALAKLQVTVADALPQLAADIAALKAAADAGQAQMDAANPDDPPAAVAPAAGT